MNLLTDREIRNMDNQLKDLRKAMDSLVKLLDYDMPELRRWQITEEAKKIWEQIQKLKAM